jgi:hypothetical protein
MKRLGGVLALVAAGLLGTAAPAASETATPTWVAEETFEFKALASSSSTTLDPDEAADQIQALEAAHQAKISTPAAEAERQQSIDAFTDLGAFAATDLAIEVFKDQLQDLTTLATEHLLESETPPVFLSDTSARINPPGQEDSSLLVSSIPLRNQQGELVSGELVADGGVFAPLSPLSEVEIPQTSSGEVNFPEADISFEFEGAESTQGRLISAGDAPGKEMVFYPNTAPDTDTAVTYILGGVETFNYLRSEISPETLTLNYTLPEGTTLAGTPDGGAAATDQDGETLLTVYPPYAIDAQGSFVPMSLTVEGDSILLNVPHRGADFAYPIMVDPVQHIRDWWTNGASAGYEGWSFHQTGTSSYASSNTCPAAVLPLDPCGGSGAGVYTSGVPGSYYPANSRGYWRWSVPGGGTSSIQSATLSSWRYRKGAATNGNPYAFFELTPGGTKTTTNASSGGSGLALTGTDNSTKYLQVGLESNSNLTLPAGSTNWRYNRVAGFTANLTDSEPPELTLGQAPSGWIGPATWFTVPATAGDAGLGMGWIKAQVGGNWISKWTAICTGTYPLPCPNGPFNTSLEFNSNDFPSGINTVPVKAVDVVGGTGHEAKNAFHVKTDGTAPELSVAGQLIEPEAKFSRNSTVAVTIDARDGEPLPPASPPPEIDPEEEPEYPEIEEIYDNGLSRSGVVGSGLIVDGVIQRSESQPCPAGNCPLVRTWGIDYANLSTGPHSAAAYAVDGAGNVSLETFSFSVPGVSNTLVSSDGVTQGTVFTKEAPSLPLVVDHRFAENRAAGEVRIEHNDGDVETTAPTDCDLPGDECQEYLKTMQLAESGNSVAHDTDLQVSADTNDVRLPKISEWKGDLIPNENPSQVSLDSVLETWQTPPPGSGDFAVVIDATESSAEVASLTVRLWVDESTGWPVKQAILGNAGTIAGDIRYWDYEPYIEDPDLVPAGYFDRNVPATKVSGTESVTYSGVQDGLTADEELGDEYEFVELGENPTISGIGELCRSRTIEQRAFYDDTYNSTAEYELPSVPAGVDFYAPATTTIVEYQILDGNDGCDPDGLDNAAPDLAVMSQHSESSDAILNVQSSVNSGEVLMGSDGISGFVAGADQEGAIHIATADGEEFEATGIIGNTTVQIVGSVGGDIGVRSLFTELEEVR